MYIVKNEALARDTFREACMRRLTKAKANDHPINLTETKILQRASCNMELVRKEELSIRTTPEEARFQRRQAAGISCPTVGLLYVYVHECVLSRAN